MSSEDSLEVLSRAEEIGFRRSRNRATLDEEQKREIVDGVATAIAVAFEKWPGDDYAFAYVERLVQQARLRYRESQL